MNKIQPLSLHAKNIRRALIIVVVGVLTLYVLLPKIHAFGLNGNTEMPKIWTLIFFAASLFLLTFVLSGLSYKLLSFTKLKLARTVLVQFASVPLNLLLPAGLGNISINYLYLKKNRHTPVRAGLVISVNNILGVIANLSMLALLVGTFGLSGNEGQVLRSHEQVLVVLIGIVCLMAAMVVYLLKGHIKRLNNIRVQLLVALLQFRSRYINVIGAYVCAAMQAIVTALVFWLCLKGYGIQLSYASSFMIYAFSVLVGAIIPTPGGLGGVEASLTAGIVATHHASASVALASVLAYRAISYWLPVFLGGFALFMANKLRWVAR